MAGCGGAVTSTSTPGAAPGGTLTRTCSTVTGTLGGSDLVLTFQAYVPKLDAGAVNIVTPAAPVNNIVNTGTANGTYAGGPVSAVSPPANLAAKLMTLRKSAALVVDPGSNGVTPGDTLEYTLIYNLSDFYAVSLVAPNALNIAESLGDGQTFLGCADANTTITAQANGTTLPVQAFPGATCTAGAKVVATGVTPITFDLGAVLTGTFGTLLHGDLESDGTQSGPTTVTVKFRATIDTAYSATPFTGRRHAAAESWRFGDQQRDQQRQCERQPGLGPDQHFGAGGHRQLHEIRVRVQRHRAAASGLPAGSRRSAHVPDHDDVSVCVVRERQHHRLFASADLRCDDDCGIGCRATGWGGSARDG